MASIFTKIIQGAIPGYRIFENDHVYSFLTLDQIRLGHCLVVPKQEIDYWVDVPDLDYLEVYKAARPIAKAIKQATNCARVGQIVLGFEVPHFHLHLVPMNGLGDCDFSKARQYPQQDCQAMQEKIMGILGA